ncbi:MAG: bacteriophage holin [Planctomycetota bacterium]
MKLNIKAFALACGLMWGLGVFCLAWWIMMFEGATGEVPFLGHLYRGFNISPLGSVIGLVWAFFDGLIGGAIFAWLYNKLASACPGKQT